MDRPVQCAGQLKIALELLSVPGAVPEKSGPGQVGILEVRLRPDVLAAVGVAGHPAPPAPDFNPEGAFKNGGAAGADAAAVRRPACAVKLRQLSQAFNMGMSAEHDVNNG